MISRSQRILGLDIGSHTVKAVELSKSGERFAITGYAQTDISAAGTIKDAIAAVLREGRFKSKQVVSSVSGRNVIVRYINRPMMKTEDLKASMRFEADKYIPFEVNEVILDCAPLDDKPLPDTNEIRVVLVAVKKQVVDEHVRLLQEAGLYPCIVDVDCFALGNSFELAGSPEVYGSEVVAEAPAAELPPVPQGAEEEGAAKDEKAGEESGKAAEEVAAAEPAKAGEEKPAREDTEKPARNVYALIDIGAQKTNINIVEDSNSYFTREVYIGGDDMTEAVSKHLNLSAAEADGAKKKGERELEVLEAVGQTIDDLANEIFLSFDYFENQFDTEIKTVYVSGGGSRLKGIHGALAQTLGRDVKSWDPTAGFDVSLGHQQAEKLRENAPQLAVALGLASRLRKV